MNSVHNIHHNVTFRSREVIDNITLHFDGKMKTYMSLIAAIYCLIAAVVIHGHDGVPRKMRQLYKQYRRHGVQGDVNTVRCISAHEGKESKNNNIIIIIQYYKTQ